MIHKCNQIPNTRCVCNEKLYCVKYTVVYMVFPGSLVVCSAPNTFVNETRSKSTQIFPHVHNVSKSIVSNHRLHLLQIVPLPNAMATYIQLICPSLGNPKVAYSK